MSPRTRALCIGAGVIVLALVALFLWQKEEVVEVVPPVVLPEVVEDVPLQPEHIGTSVEGRPIEVYTFGTGERTVLFVGGVHGGYEWNSVLLAYAFIDYFGEDPARIPHGFSVQIIPSLNPDGVHRVLGLDGRFAASDVPSAVTTAPGRFNAHDVDLNRNFDCKWQPESMWRGKAVSAGTAAFSEPEAAALRDHVDRVKPRAVVFWHSQANAVYASECTEGILEDTRGLMEAYATAGGYAAVDVFDAYPVTGDAEGWLASIGIPAITVELSSHDDIDWEQNVKGVEAALRYAETYIE